ncbi:hypothetical protein D9M72_213060 [compost metagenome]
MGRIFLDGVGADLLQGALEVAVDTEVIGGDLHLGRHARHQERHVARLDLRLYQQAVFHRDHFHDRLAGLDHPAAGVDQHCVDPSTHRRKDLGAAQLVLALLDDRLQGAEVGLALRALGVGVLEVGALELGQFAVEGGDVLAQFQRFHLAYRALGHQRADQFELAPGQADLLLDRLAALQQLVPPRFEQLALGTRQGPLRIDIRRELDGRLAQHLGIQPGDGRSQHGGLIGRFLEVCEEVGVIETHQRLPDLHQVALLHQQLVENPPFQALDLLDAAERHYPPVAASHLVELRPGGPDDEQHHATEEGPEQRAVNRVGGGQQGIVQLPSQLRGLAFRAHGYLLRPPAAPVPGCPAPPGSTGHP